MMPAKVLVIGGGGFVGSCLVSRLAKQGIQATVPTRRREKRKSLSLLPGVELLAANVHDPMDLEEMVAEADAVINLSGMLHDRDSRAPYGRNFAAAHVELPEKIVAAMKRTGVRRLLHVSTVGAAENAPSAFYRSKAAGDAIVLNASDTLDVTVFRPSLIFGPGDSCLNLFALLMEFAPFLLLSCTKTRFQPVYVGDVADALICALDRSDTFGNVYELCGPRIYTLRQLVEYVGELTGRRRPVIELTGALARLQAKLLGFLPNPPMSPDSLRSLQIDNVADGHLNFPVWQPQSLEAVAPTYLGPSKSKARLSEFRARHTLHS